MARVSLTMFDKLKSSLCKKSSDCGFSFSSYVSFLLTGIEKDGYDKMVKVSEQVLVTPADSPTDGSRYNKMGLEK